MRTEIDPTFETLGRDLSEDEVTIHFWKKPGWKREVVDVGGACYRRACVVFKASGNLAQIFLEIEEDDFNPDDGELLGTETTYIPFVDVYDVVVNRFGEDPNYPTEPYARWLRNRGGQLVRWDLNL